MKNILTLIFALCCMCMHAQTVPQFKLTTFFNGEEVAQDAVSGGVSAPLQASFHSNPVDTVGWDLSYEWTIARQESRFSPFTTRFDENLDYQFNESGEFIVQLKVICRCRYNDALSFTFPETAEDENTFVVTILQSVLELPNTFTPNGDGYNDEFRVKEGHQSIISFEAAVYNRWGQKLYSWTDINGSWDGRYNGSVVKDGAYYVVVKAKGADGQDYKIRKAINVLTTSNKDEAGTTQ